MLGKRHDFWLVGSWVLAFGKLFVRNARGRVFVVIHKVCIAVAGTAARFLDRVILFQKSL
jgi:hypothetical protein